MRTWWYRPFPWYFVYRDALALAKDIIELPVDKLYLARARMGLYGEANGSYPISAMPMVIGSHLMCQIVGRSHRWRA